MRLVVIAPDGNRSAMARSITTRRPLWVTEVDFGDGNLGYATDGTPVDCVRLANLGLIDDFEADLVVAGINHGANLGDDITYSGTVAAALEGVVLGVPSIAVSQQSRAGELDFAAAGNYDFALAAAFVARLVALARATRRCRRRRCSTSTCRGATPAGVEVTRLGKRVYRDELRLDSEEEGRRRYWIYGTSARLRGRARHRPRRGRARSHRGDAAAFRSDRPARDRGARDSISGRLLAT